MKRKPLRIADFQTAQEIAPHIAGETSHERRKRLRAASRPIILRVELTHGEPLTKEEIETQLANDAKRENRKSLFPPYRKPKSRAKSRPSDGVYESVLVGVGSGGAVSAYQQRSYTPKRK